MTKKNRLLKGICIALVSVLLSACLPEFTNPIVSADQANADSRLLGLWKFKDNLSTSYLHITHAEPKTTGSNWLMATLIEHRSNGTSDVKRYRFITSKIGKRHFVNAINEDSEFAQDYLLLEYSLKKNTLEVGLINDAIISEAVSEGILGGETHKQQLTTTLVINSPSNELVAFVQKIPSNQLFDTKVSFNRH